jgi:hypothetical protein
MKSPEPRLLMCRNAALIAALLFFTALIAPCVNRKLKADMTITPSTAIPEIVCG